MQPPDNDQHHHAKEEHFFTTSRVLTGLAMGSAAAVILAPHILPALGFGSDTLSEEAALMLGHKNLGRGLAGSLNGVLRSVPLIGDSLAAGGAFTSIVSGVVGIGGLMLGNYISKKEEGHDGFKWGKLIRYAALATSALIALPTILTSLGTGIIYLAMLAKGAGFLTAANATATVGMVSKTLGTIGGMGQHAMMGLGGLAAAIPHLFTCGIPFLPMALSGTLLKDNAHSHEQGQAAGEGAVATVTPDSPVEAGKPCTLRVMLVEQATGRSLTQDDLAVTHTEKLHLLVVDQSLRDYHHLHPKPTDEPGVYTVTFTPKTGNGYTAWADFTTARDGQAHRVASIIPPALKRNVPATVAMSDHAEKDGLQCDWESNAPLQKGKETLVHIDVKDEAGNPVKDLEPIMGAYAHLVGFSADGKTLIHSHPVGQEPSSSDDRGGSRLSFHIAPETEGNIQFYLQLKRGGQEVMVPFGQRIRPPSAAVEKELAQRHSHSHANAGHAI